MSAAASGDSLRGRTTIDSDRVQRAASSRIPWTRPLLPLARALRPYRSIEVTFEVQIAGWTGVLPAIESVTDCR